MEVLIRIHNDLQSKAGTDKIRLPIDESETVDTLMMRLSRRHSRLVETVLDPTTGEVRSDYDILLNGRQIQHIRGIYTKVKHKDELMISPHTDQEMTE